MISKIPELQVREKKQVKKIYETSVFHFTVCYFGRLFGPAQFPTNDVMGGESP